MRRDQFEIGIEREYALYASLDDTIACLLAVERLLASFEALGDQRWQRMRAEGWRIAPEYSKCLVEIASPPYTADGWPDLHMGFVHLESLLDRAAEQLQAQSWFDQIECTAKYSVRTDRFATWDGTFVTTFADLLLDGAHDNWLVGTPDAIPACFAQSTPELLYACFTSTNATVHSPASDQRDVASYYWQLLHDARRIELESPQRHPFLREGRIPVAPDPEVSVRDALVRWGDPQTAALLDALPIAPAEQAARFHALVGPDFHAYSCRPRVVEDVTLFELRCFHPGMDLLKLAKLVVSR